MTERLTPDDFNHLFGRFEQEAFRFEVQPVYLVAEERETFEEFLRGEPRPITEFPFFTSWLDQIKAATSEGRRVIRVRVLEDPPTDYQRWEVWAGQYNAAVGEEIRYLARAKATAAGIPLTDDWWLFDRRRLARMRFDADGTPLGGYIVSDPETITQHCKWRDLAVRLSAPAPERATA
jgi:hypothetical protein